MKVKLLSDLHLDFGGYDAGTGDVLVLAGDILSVKELMDESPQGRYYRKFLESCCNSYNKVFYVMGNHEHYYHNIDRTARDLNRVFDVENTNITLLDNSYETYEGVNFIGGTLWTDYNGQDQTAMSQAFSSMTDYFVIEENIEAPNKLSPLRIVDEHRKTVSYLTETVPTLEGPTVVVTHHAPNKASLCGDYVEEELAPAYYSDLTTLIEKIKPDYWMHGHIHHTNDYKVGETRVLSNPRGYAKYNENPDFNREFEIDVTVEKVSQET